jgi:ATP-dependent helicase/nuclease subunit A
VTSLCGMLTPQQQQAVSCREVSVVLSSGAGCGKTHVLTQRYLSHLEEDGAEVGQVVAITFTDRAARQMRERIRQAVLHHLRTAATDQEADRWARHLRGLETAQISTIHAFCATLLRQHAVEAGIDPGFEVLEDVLATNLEIEALTGCLQRLLTAKAEAGEDLRELVLLYGWRPVVEGVQHLLQGWDEPACRAWVTRTPTEIARDWLEHARTVVLPRYVGYLLAAAPRIVRCLDLLRRKPPLPGSKMADNVGYLLTELPRLATAPDLAAAVNQLLEAAKVGRHGAKAWPVEEDYQAAKEALEEFREDLRGRRLEAFTAPGEDLPLAVRAGQRFVRVAAEAMSAYRDLKRQHSVVDFQDLLVRARDLLRDHPEVRARLQERYRFLLIDELQDTDPVQMDVVQHLCGGGLTEGKLFAVGDHSQSVYRFRGADVHLFRRLRESMAHEGRLGLTLNFRSQPQILDFANALFSPRLTDYEPLRAFHPQVNPGACVEFLWSPRGDSDNVNEARAREADWIARRIALMVGRERLVREPLTPQPPLPQRGEGEEDNLPPLPLWERGVGGVRGLRPVRQGDVVLLFRAMTNVHLYEAALRRHGLDYYLVGGRAFFAQQEIYDLLNLLRALENPQDGVALAGTLRSPFCCLSDESLFVLGRRRDGLWAGLHDPDAFARLPADQRPAAERARRNLERWRSLKDRLPIARLLGAVFADSGYDAATQFEFLGDRKLANLWKLLDLARTFDRSGLFGLADFIGRLGDLVRTQPREEQAATQPENADVVRLMTIHQAKGLEFPVVFVPDLTTITGAAHQPVAHWDARLGCVVRPPVDEEQTPFPDFGWRLWQAGETVEDWHEDLRTLYVACTRAEDYLVLSAALPESFRPSGAWMCALAERFDLGTGNCLDSGIAKERRPKVRVLLHVESFRHELSASGGVDPRRDQPGGSPLNTAAQIAPVAVSLRGKRIITIAELEQCLHTPTAAVLGWQFDTEDGSDGSTWLTPRQRMDSVNDPQQAELDHLLRAVLARWDFATADGWRAFLVQGGTAAPWMERFATSEVRHALASAVRLHREVEFLLRWPCSSQEEEPICLRGVLDILWEDRDGGRHLLFFGTQAEDETALQQHKPGLLVGAHAVRQQWGGWPKTATYFCLASGQTVRLTSRQMQQRQVLAAIDRVLNDLARRTLRD